MENFIPFIIGIAFFVYKTWVNFQAEQDKAKKRTPSTPRVPQASEKKSTSPVQPSSSKQVGGKKPEPFLLEETIDPNNPYEPKYKHLYQKEKSSYKGAAEKKVTEEKQEQNLYNEGYNPEKISDEVKHNRTIHQQHNHNKKLHTQDEPEEAIYHFDMKDAIIKEAILNRPNY